MKKILIVLIITGLFYLCFMSSTSTAATVPGQPVNCSRSLISNETEHHMAISWEPPMLDGGAEITGYQLEYTNSMDSYEGNQSDIWVILETNINNTNYTHSYSTSEDYCYRISAINSEGVGLPSLYFSPSCGGMARIPDAPTNVEATRISGSQIDISWNHGEDDNGLPVFGFKIEYKTYDDQTIKVLVENTNNLNTSYSHSSPNNDWHYYRIYALNAVGRSLASPGWAEANNWEGYSTIPGPPINLVGGFAQFGQLSFVFTYPSQS